MARLFTLNFQFQEQQHTALIAVGTSPQGTVEYTVSVYDEAVQRLLPNGKLCFHHLADLKACCNGQPQALELLESLSAALQHRLEEAPVR